MHKQYKRRSGHSSRGSPGWGGQGEPKPCPHLPLSSLLHLPLLAGAPCSPPGSRGVLCSHSPPSLTSGTFCFMVDTAQVNGKMLPKSVAPAALGCLLQMPLGQRDEVSLQPRTKAVGPHSSLTARGRGADSPAARWGWVRAQAQPLKGGGSPFPPAAPHPLRSLGRPASPCPAALLTPTVMPPPPAAAVPRPPPTCRSL